MGRRRALLIATAHYEDTRWNPLDAPVRDAEELGRVLGDPAIGGYEVTQVVDHPAPSIQRALQSFFNEAERDDDLLVYFSCHGIKDYDELLYFAGTDTVREPGLVESYAVSAEFVSRQLRRCRADRKILLLDCCFSGAFRPGAKGGPGPGAGSGAGAGIGFAGTFEGSGTVVISATDEMQLAFEIVPGGDTAGSAGSPMSVFTSLLVQGLDTGAADVDADGYVSAADLYKYVSAEMRAARTRQTPKQWVLDGVGNLIVALCGTGRPRLDRGFVNLAQVEGGPEWGALALFEGATLPEDMQAPTISDMREGQVAYTLPWGMWADENRRLWLHPRYPAEEHPAGTTQMKIMRVRDGFHVWPPPDQFYQPGGGHYVGGTEGRLPVLKLVR